MLTMGKKSTSRSASKNPRERKATSRSALKNPISRSSLEAAVALILGIITVVFPQTWYLKIVLMMIICGIVIHIIAKSLWTIEWSSSLKVTASLVVIVILSLLSWKPVSEQWIKDNIKIAVSPSEVTVIPQTQKDFNLKVLNTQDFAVFDVHLSICTNNKVLVISPKDVRPVVEEDIPGVPISMFGIHLTNGCTAIIFGSVNAHTTKEFYIKIRGEKMAVDSKVKFEIYNWSLEPSFFSVRTSKKYASEGAPRNLGEMFESETGQTEKTGHAYIRKIKVPKNEFFPDDISEEEFNAVVFTDF